MGSECTNSGYSFPTHFLAPVHNYAVLQGSGWVMQKGEEYVSPGAILWLPARGGEGMTVNSTMESKNCNGYWQCAKALCYVYEKLLGGAKYTEVLGSLGY